MYPRNAASPERIAIGAVVQISDGAVQTSGVSISVRGQGGASGAGSGTTAYDNGIVQYTPTQGETDFTSFVVVAYKTGCIPVAQTIVTSASATPGHAGLDWGKVINPTTVVGLSGTTVKTATDVETATANIQSRLPESLVSGRINATVNAISGDTAAADALEAMLDGTGGVTITATIAGNITGNLSGSVGSVTGAVGSVTGAVGSVTAGVTVTTNNDKTGYSLSTTPPTAAAIADAVWDETLADHLTAGSTGAGLNAAGSAGDPWSTALPGSYTGTQAGKVLADVLADTGTDGVVVATASKTGYTLSSAGVQAIWDALTSALTTAGSIGKRIVDYLTGDVYARIGAPAGASLSADVAAVKSQTAAIETDTQDIQSRVPAALTAGGNMKADALALNGDTTSAANIAKTTRAIARGTASSGASTTSIPTSAFSPAGAAADQFKGRIVTFDADTTTAALRGQSTDITASSNSATPTLTVTALTTAPASGDTFSVT